MPQSIYFWRHCSLTICQFRTLHVHVSLRYFRVVLALGVVPPVPGVLRAIDAALAASAARGSVLLVVQALLAQPDHSLDLMGGDDIAEHVGQICGGLAVGVGNMLVVTGLVNRGLVEVVVAHPAPHGSREGMPVDHHPVSAVLDVVRCIAAVLDQVGKRADLRSAPGERLGMLHPGDDGSGQVPVQAHGALARAAECPVLPVRLAGVEHVDRPRRPGRISRHQARAPG